MAEGTEIFLGKARQLVEKGEYAAAAAAFTDFLEEEDDGTLDATKHSEVLRGRGWAYIRCSELDSATKDYEKALGLSTNANDPVGMADALRGLGHIQWQKGALDPAMERLQKALALAKKTSDKVLLGSTYIDMGNVHVSKGEFQAAIDTFHWALDLLEAAGNAREMARAFNNMGDALVKMERLEEGMNAYERSITIGKEVGNESAVAWARSNVAECLVRLGKASKATEELEMALSEFERVGDMEGASHVYRVYGLYYTLQKEWNLAGQALKRSLLIADKFGIREMRAFANQAIGMMLMAKGEKEESREYLERSLEEFMDLKMPVDAEATRNILKKTMWS